MKRSERNAGERMTTSLTQWSVGDARVTRIDEIELEGQGAWLLPDVTPEMVAAQSWLDPSAADEHSRIRLSVHSFLVEVAEQRVLVDTGVGNGKTHDNPAWNGLATDYLRTLEAAGLGPDTVDIVVNTHIHRDHVGWNTQAVDGTWVPTFTRARYIVAEAEWMYWSEAELSADQERIVVDSIAPVRDAGLWHPVEVDNRPVEIATGVELVSSPGHTPGHVSVRITSAGRSALISGDVIHHPVQLAHYNLTCVADLDPTTAIRTRTRLLSDLADSETLLLGTHFTHPTGGWIRTTDAGYRLVSSA